MISYKKLKPLFFVLVVAVTGTACNKEFEDVNMPSTATTLGTGQSLADVINTDTAYSFFKALVTKAGSSIPAYSNTSLRFTAFLPKNDVFRAMGITSTTAVGAVFTTSQAVGIVNYAFTPQLLKLNDITTSYPNLQAPTMLNPTVGTPLYSPFVSLSSFPSRRGTSGWINNIPLIATDITTSNGYIHNTSALLIPPSATLWSRISTDADMTFFKAAVSRGDSGQVGTARIDSLLNLAIGPNFTVFVPTNAAMQAVLIGQITLGLMAQGVPQATAQAQATSLVTNLGPGIFSYAPLYSTLTAQTVKGLVVYHMMGSRFYTVNFPTTSTLFPTLLNSAVPTHPGVALAASFTGMNVVAATVKGIANATPSNILINPLSTSDQNYTNGVLHKIDQVLLPQ